MVPDYICCKYLSRTRINITGSHRISNRSRCIFHTTVAHIIRIKIRIIAGIIQCLHYIFKTSRLKCHIPVFNTLFHHCTPFFRKSSVYIEYNRFHRFYQFSLKVFLQIFFLGFQSPTMNKGLRHNFIFRRGV